MVVGFLTSCETVNTQNISSETKFNISILEPDLVSLSKWKVSGVIGVVYNNHADSANYVYSQNGDTFNIKLYGPLGISVVEIFSDKSKVTLKKGDKSIQSNSVKSLMMTQLGWYFPIDGLKYWIKATIAPDLSSQHKYYPNKLISQLFQGGWVISYYNYQLVNNRYPLPTKINMIRDNLSLKIIIKHWQI